MTDYQTILVPHAGTIQNDQSWMPSPASCHRMLQTCATCLHQCCQLIHIMLCQWSYKGGGKLTSNVKCMYAATDATRRTQTLLHYSLDHQPSNVHSYTHPRRPTTLKVSYQTQLHVYHLTHCEPWVHRRGDLWSPAVKAVPRGASPGH